MMHSITSALAPALLLLASAVSVHAQNPKATPYSDASTGISFPAGFYDPSGYQFGMVLPSSGSSSTDMIIQLVSPLKDGGGWAGVDFGDSMTGRLLLVAWPSGKGSDSSGVTVAPRIANGYKQADTVAYTANPVTLTTIAKGTFVNATHVSATFVCRGCMNADSFTTAGGTQSLSYAYSLLANPNPGDVNTMISDHTTLNEPYGGFDVDLAAAQSSQYASYAAMVSTGAGGAGGTGTATAGNQTATGTGTTGVPKATATTEGSGSGSGGQSAGAGSEEDADTAYKTLNSGAVAALVLAGVLYVLQAFSVF